VPKSGPSPNCRFCGAPLTRSFADLGETPLANAYLTRADLRAPEPRFPLHAKVCDQCFLVQLDYIVASEEIFSEYAYFSSQSNYWVEQARNFAETMRSRLGLGADSLVIEVGSNDGYLLRHFVARGIPVLGIDPAENVARTAEAAGVPTLKEFFGGRVARQLAADGKLADLLVGNNVLAQSSDLNDFVAGLHLLLGPSGIISIEFPHLLRLIEAVEFDTIYHEHRYYFSLIAIERIFTAHNLRVFDVEKLSSHGGSLRIFACRVEQDVSTTTVLKNLRAEEQAAGLRRGDSYDSFARKIPPIGNALRSFLVQAKAEKKVVVAYGAAAKGNTMLCYRDIGPELIRYVVDDTPYKQGRYLPGSHIPIVSADRLLTDRPDLIVILPWNHRDELMKKAAYVRDWGARFVVAIPKLEIL